MLTIPRVLRTGLGTTSDGAAWLTRVPGLVSDAVGRWDLRLGEPFEDGHSSWTAPARVLSGARAGADVVLKVSYPHGEARSEAAGLALWHGHGAAPLIDSDAVSWSLLLERCRPGTALRDDPREASARLTDAATSLRSLHDAGARHVDTAAGGASSAFPSVREICAGLADLLASRLEAVRGAPDLPFPLDDGLVGLAVSLLRELPGTSGRDVVVHGDANPGNILRHDGTWLWIDPKPMTGDAAFDPWPLVSQVDDPFAADDPVAALRERTRLVAGILDLDPARIAAWGVARTVESAMWSWAAMRDEGRASRGFASAHVWREFLAVESAG